MCADEKDEDKRRDNAEYYALAGNPSTEPTAIDDEDVGQRGQGGKRQKCHHGHEESFKRNPV